MVKTTRGNALETIMSHGQQHWNRSLVFSTNLFSKCYSTNLFIQQLLNSYHEPGTDLSAKDQAGNRRVIHPLWEMEGTEINNVREFNVRMLDVYGMKKS